MRTFGRIAALAIVALAAAFWTAPALAAGGSASVTGVVYNATSGAPVAGALLTLTGAGTTATATSDPNGIFTFGDLAAGTYALRTTAPQYQLTTSSAISVAAGATVNLAVSLQPVSTTSISTLGHVTVKGHQTLNTSTAAVETISSNTYVNTGTEQIEQLLETTPGITVEHFDNGAPGNVATFTIRGTGGFVGGSDTGYEILVLQDGEPIRNGEYGDDDVSGLTPAIYSRVEVVEGVGGTSLFGANTIGGTINLVTIDPKATEGAEEEYTVGGFGTAQNNIALTNTYGKFGFVLDYHEYSTDGFIPNNLLVDTPPFTFSPSATSPPQGNVQHPTLAMVLHSGLGKLRYDFSKSVYGVLTVTDEADWRDQFGLLANPETVFLLSNFTSYSKDPKGYPYFYGFPQNYVWNTDPKYAFDVHSEIGGGSLVVRYYDNWISRWADGNNAPTYSCCYLQKSIDHLSGELATYEKVFGNNDVAISVGGNGDAFQYGFCSTFEVHCTAAAIVPTTGTQIEDTALIRDDDALSPSLDATFAGYYSDYSDLNVKRFDPRLGFNDKLDASSAVRFSVGSGFAAPTLSDIVTPLDLNINTSVGGPNCTSSNEFCNATSGNPNLKEETAFGYDLGYERTFGLQGDFSADLYRTQLQNHIFTAILPAPSGLLFSDGSTPVLGISEPINIAGSVYQGLELAGTVPVTNDFNVRAYYNTQSAYPVDVDRLTEENIGDVVNNEQYLGVPLHKIGWAVNFQNNAHVNAFFGADWFAQNNSYNVPPFWSYNAGITLPYSGDTMLHLAWRNIFNKNAPIFSTFDGGVPYAGINGPYATSAFSTAPHMFTITLDQRFGSLK
jgi:outer membrane receptor protein involved in Fe transport